MNNDNKNLNTEPTTEILSIEPPKRSWWKYALGAIGLIILVVGGYIGWKIYDFESGVRKVQQTAEFLKKLEEDDYKAAMADTYGGKTPQETLQMYIDAVEKGDYELASKYFIGDKQKKEFESFNNSKQEDIKYILNILRKTEIVDLRAQLVQMYDAEIKKGNTPMYDAENKDRNIPESKEHYVNRLYQVWDYDKKAWMDAKVDGHDLSVSFKKYPNGIWKIIEI